MTDPMRRHLVRELAALEAALANRIVVAREILSPTYVPGADRYAAPLGWRVTGRIVRSFRAGATYPKEEPTP
jgi:hypothetical protein